MNRYFWRLSITLLGVIVIARIAFADAKMDEKTHDLVIEKLEHALSTAKEDETLSLVPVRARLADLYAERARLKAMTEAEKSCTACTGAREDRVRALKLYVIVENEAAKENKGPILLQMAHLYRMIGEAAKSDAIAERIVREGASIHSESVLSQGYAGRAEARFAKGDYLGAQKDFESAARLAPSVRKGPLVHRIAWCQLNKGEQSAAVATLVKILESPDLLMRETTEGPKLDASFQDDVSQDLATFLARAAVGPKQINLIEELSSDRAKRDNLKRLASETERLGAKRAALLAWDAFLEIEGGDQDRLETLVRVARIRFDLGEKKQALVSMQSAADLWKAKGCAEVGTCENLRLHLRRLVTDWNRIEKKKPTGELLAAYQSYVSLFKEDIEMTFWAALIARELGHSSDAIALYHASSLLASKADPKATGTPKNIKEILETSLVGEIEMAEAQAKSAKGRDAIAKANDQRQASYDHYLALNGAGPAAHQVRYQRARLSYERGDTTEAVKRLEAFATSTECRSASEQVKSSLCVQAADLDLDARVLLKNDASIESGALTYAKLYSARKTEYLRIARTAALRQAETMAPESAIVKLAAIDMTGADKAERTRLLKTRVSVAEKAKDLSATRKAAEELLAVPGLSADDHEFALSRMEWAAEMSFDFAEAYRLALRHSPKNLKPADYELRLALLAELSGKNPRQHQENFLKLSHDSQTKALVRAKMIRAAHNPAAEYRRHAGDLRILPGAQAALALEIFAHTGDRAFAEQALRDPRVARDPAGRAMRRNLVMAEIVRLDSKISGHQIHTESDGILRATLGKRLQILADVEDAANRAIASRDWAAQALALTIVSRENQRLGRETRALPVPKKLKGKERDSYLKIVENKAKTFDSKHDAIEEKLKTLWKDEASVTELAQSLEDAHPEVRSLLARDLKPVVAVAPFSQRRKLEGALSRAGSVPESSEVASAIREAKERPFNDRRLARLRELESGRGRETMVAYLDARIAKLKEGGSR